MKSYVVLHANGARNGRIAVASRSFSRLRGVARLSPPRASPQLPPGMPELYRALLTRAQEQQGEAPMKSPEWVVIPEGGAHLAVGYGDGYPFEIRGRSGEPVATPFSLVLGRAFIASDDGVWTQDMHLGWDGHKLPGSLPFCGTMIAAHLERDVLVSVVRVEPQGGYEGPNATPRRLYAWAHRRAADGSWQMIWQDSIDGSGSGAIRPNGQVALVSSEGRLRVVGPETETEGRAIDHVDVQTGVLAYDASAMSDGYVLVEPLRTWAPAPKPGGSGAALESAIRTFQSEQEARSALYLDAPSSTLEWKTGVVGLDFQGQARFRAEAPFRVLSPPIDVSRGRVVVVGEGCGMLENGHWKWTLASTVRLFATAFDDGTLAVSAGPELWLITPDGQKAVIAVPDGEAITTPPAIGADGAVWVATSSQLFVAE